MDKATLINALLEWAEWWEDTTGMVNKPALWESSVDITAQEYGVYENAKGDAVPWDSYTTGAHAWFLLFIVADLEYVEVSALQQVDPQTQFHAAYFGDSGSN